MKEMLITLNPEPSENQDMTIRQALSLALLSEEARKILLLGFTQAQAELFEKYLELLNDAFGYVVLMKHYLRPEKSEYVTNYQDKLIFFEDLKEDKEIADLVNFFKGASKTGSNGVINERYKYFASIIARYIYKALDELEEAVEVK